MVKTQTFNELKTYVFEKISKGFDNIYTYHTVAHICMVLRDATFLCNKLGISDNDLRLVKTAAILHDYGFVNSHINHEERSCNEGRKLLPNYGYTDEEIETICSMIMATKIPQSPKCKLDQILCDADLFYLGSDYYFEIANLFKRELTSLGVLKNEQQWKDIQVGFLENHHFHLSISQQLLDKTKAKNLSILKASK